MSKIVGKEWDKVFYHHISRELYGFDGKDRKALKAGAGFIFYTPDAIGHIHGTELCGTMEFWTW